MSKPKPTTWDLTNSFDPSMSFGTAKANAKHTEIIGPYRFVRWNNIESLNLLSINAAFAINFRKFMTDHEGAFSVWMSPLEDMEPGQFAASYRQADESSSCVNLLSDNFPPHKHEESHLGFFATLNFIPSLKIKAGRGLSRHYYNGSPTIHIEALPFRRNYWYHLGFKWQKSTGIFVMYVNGEEVNYNTGFFDIQQLQEMFFVGSPYLCMSNMRLSGKCVSAAEFKKSFNADLARGYPLDPNIGRYIHVNPPGEKLEIDRGDWIRKDAYSFKKPADLQGWRKQGPNKVPLSNLKTTRDGLLFETCKSLHPLNLCHIWSPNIYSANSHLYELDLRVEQPEGLALFVYLAAGFQDHDFIRDYGLANTGNLSTICFGVVKNYHWEFFRRMPCNRKDLETQVLVKNPYLIGLGSALVPAFEVGKWYHMTFLKQGNDITLAINDHIILQATDNPFVGNGPSNYTGRMAIRHMQWTKITYRDLTISLKDEIEVLSEHKGTASLEESTLFTDEPSYMDYAK
ncbi:MAG: YesU family protein [Phycisphaerales bacterium]|nr:YesU family protein [Phycisphaerales bacterium]